MFILSRKTLVIIKTSMLSCGNNLIPQWHWHWWHIFEDPKLASPSPPRSLPVYVETMAFVLVAQSCPFPTHKKTIRSAQWILDFRESEAESCSTSCSKFAPRFWTLDWFLKLRGAFSWLGTAKTWWESGATSTPLHTLNLNPCVNFLGLWFALN